MAESKTRAAETDERRSEREVCDILVRNGYVITLDAKRTIYPCGAVAIRGNSVVAVGNEREIVPRFIPRCVLDARGGSLHPGFVDAYYHTTIHRARGSEGLR